MLSIRNIVPGLLVPAALCAFASAHPPVFTDTTYDAALAENAKNGKILIVDAMTTWCGPCKMMDKTSWVDEHVVTWIGANAVAIQLDMDKNKELGKSLAIHAFPTILVFKDGREFDRVIGSRDSAALLQWLEGTSKGLSARDQTLAMLKTARESAARGETIDYRLRVGIAEDLYEYGKYEEATEELEWLWTTMPEGQVGVENERHGGGRVANAMTSLARRHKPALERFTALRDDAGKKMKSPESKPDDLRDWVTLNGIIGDTDSTVRWAVAMQDTSENIAALRSVAPQVFGLLIAGNEWSTAGKALEDPAGQIDRRGSQIGAYDVKPSKEKTPTSMPAIPLRTGDGSKPAPAAPVEEPKTIPAIPLNGGGDAAPAAPVQDEKKPTSLPAIPIRTEPGKTTTTLALPITPSGEKYDPTDPEQLAKEVRRRLTIEFRGMAADYYAACLAAGREAEAAGVAGAALKYADDSQTRISLVSRAVQAKSARPEHRDWLEQAGKAGADVAAARAELEAALGAK